MATIELKKVEKKFGDLHAVQPMDLTIDNGEFVVLLGPSGCGKTTTLRMISGLEAVSGGDIFLDGRKVTWLHPSERDIAFVFQLFALYPHMTAYENIAFPLQAEGASKEAVAQRVKEVVELLQIHHLLDLRPRKLSGGDLQRIALARALVRRPAAFLMDEPLGALDTDFRETMRAEIKKLHINQNATTVYVTHDQIEAMAMGDRIVVMSDAVVQQVGTPDEVYYDPANLFVAQFIGSPGMNLVSCKHVEGVIQLPGESRYSLPNHWRAALEQDIGSSGEVIIGFRPEAAQIKADGPIAGEVYASELYGSYTLLHVSLGGDESVVHIRSDRLTRYDLGSQVHFDINPDMTRFFNPETEHAINPQVSA
jgi:multiple sugar transport system ATP-binding protein